MSDVFPVRLAIPVEWGEMDSYRHVNNTVYFRWFESARMEYFARIGWPGIERETGVGPILHSTAARFRAPVAWPDEIEVATRVGEVESDRFTMYYRIRSRALAREVAVGTGLIVAFDYRSGTKAPLPPAIRDGIARLQAEGVSV